MRVIRRIVKISFAVTLLLLGLGIIGWVITDAIATHRLNRTLRSLREQGYATSIDDLASPPLAEEENAAPLWKEACARIVRQDPKDKAFQKLGLKGLAALDQDEKKRIRTWLERNAEALSLISHAQSRTRCRYGGDCRKRNNFLSWGFHSSKPAELLSIQAQVQAADGDQSAAREAVRGMFALAASMKDELDPLFQIYRRSVVRFALDTIDRCVTPDTSESDGRAWTGLLPIHDDIWPASELMSRLMLAHEAETFEHCPRYGWICWSAASGVSLRADEVDRDSHKCWRRILSCLFSPVIKLDANRRLNLRREEVEIFRMPFAEAREEALALHQKAVEGPFWAGAISRGFAMDLQYSVTAGAELLRRSALIRAGIEGEFAYRSQGRYPDELQTRDPCTGERLRISHGRVDMPQLFMGQYYSSNLTWILRHKEELVLPDQVSH